MAGHINVERIEAVKLYLHRQQFLAWPTPEVFAACIKWPGVSPYLPEGAAHQNDAEVGVNNEKDEGEHGA
ncbi:hypothetical protein TSUD_286570 [Trifolium subterraneum]|uniref:Uncharacterized protein n=1 Tax=Trifolium subterraneum TaxID=3900 RepID=A0A2Z6P858_TRISU|nr:hypothetical protein TSUD_286570 [Trifolium subterraneum]